MNVCTPPAIRWQCTVSLSSRGNSWLRLAIKRVTQNLGCKQLNELQLGGGRKIWNVSTVHGHWESILFFDFKIETGAFVCLSVSRRVFCFVSSLFLRIYIYFCQRPKISDGWTWFISHYSYTSVFLTQRILFKDIVNTPFLYIYKRMSVISSVDINISITSTYCSSDSFFLCIYTPVQQLSCLHAAVTKFQCLTLFRMTPFKQQWHPVVSKPPSPSWWHVQPTSKQWWLIPLSTWPIWLMTSCRPSLRLTLLLTPMSLLMR